MPTIIKSSTSIRQNHNKLSELATKIGLPIFLTKSSESDLIVMDITTYCQCEKQLKPHEKLFEIEERRRAGLPDTPARKFIHELRARYLK